MARTSLQRAVTLPTTKTSGDLRKARTKTTSPARGTRGDGSGAKRPPSKK